MTFIIVTVGLYSIFDLGKVLMPSVPADRIFVKTDAGDLSAIEVERNITTPLEQRLEGLKGVKTIQSTTNIGENSIQLTVEDGKGEEVLKEVESIVNGAKSELIGAEDIITGQYGAVQAYELFMDVSGGNLDEMADFATEVLEPRLESLAEVGDVSLAGLPEHEVIIDVDKRELEKYNISIGEVADVIQQFNHAETLGNLKMEEDSPSIRWDTRLENIKEIENVTIPTEIGLIKLGDIANVSKQTIESASSVWKNGAEDFIFVQISRASDVTQIEMRDAVREEVQNIRDENLVKGFSLTEIVAQADYVEDSINGIAMNILIGGVIAIAVLLIFMRNLRATVIISISIPSSILLTFSIMWLFDYSFNMLTLIGLGLGIGMIVDSSIVILESIYKKKELGLGNFEAALTGTKEVSRAIFASIITTIIVFVPVGFISGEIGQYVKILSLLVAITLISSLIISFTLIPTLSEKFLKLEKHKLKKDEGVILKGYGKTISWAIKKKYRSLLIILFFFSLFGGSLVLVSKIPINVMPDMFNRYTEVMAYLETGVNKEEKDAIVAEMNKKLQQIQDVESNYVLDMGGELYTIINMTKDDGIVNEQKVVNEEIMEGLRSLTDSLPITSIQGVLADTGGSGYPIQITVRGEDFEELTNIAKNFAEEIEPIDGIVGITTSVERTTNEQLIELKQEDINEAGLTEMQVKQVIQQALLERPVGQIRMDNENLRLTLAMGEEVKSKESLLDLTIPTNDGEESLSSYIRLETIKTPNEIYHEDGQRFITISADIEDVDLGSVNRKIQQAISEFELPSGYTLSVAGDLKQQQELMIEMILVITLAIFLVYFVMAIQFNKWGQPIIIMSVIPLALIGVIVGLFFTKMELNILSAMGIVMLIGIVLNNAILLIDRFNQLLIKGYSIHDSLVKAGKDRLRPIFMTTVTTIGGMLPLALESGTAGNYQAPLATVVISGLLFATLITLLLIPSICNLFSFSRKKAINVTVKAEEKVANE